MSRRKNQIFNLSFLDLITGALGAVIFLFIITPKGGSSAPAVNQVVMYMDTTEMKVFGNLHDSLIGKRVGDTLLTVLVDYKNYPRPEKRKVEEKKIDFNMPPVVPVKQTKPDPKPKPPATKPPVKEPAPSGHDKSPEFNGDAPSVPAKVSFEISWANKTDNVDFFVCKDGTCVYGGRKNVKTIGQWDSGKSRNRLFGNDLRTTQEAVRQFEKLIPGEYSLYAQFKKSSRDRQSVTIRGLIYTKGTANKERGETYVKKIPLGNSRTLIGKVILREDGTYQFIK